MPNTRMDTRFDSLEGTVSTLEDGFAKLHTDHELFHSKFAAIEDLLSTIARGKTVLPESEVTPSPTSIPLPSAPASFSDGFVCCPKEFQNLDQTLLTARRIELPLFDGTDLLGWLTRAEQFFELNGTRSEHKIHLAVICMDGNTVHWLRWLRQRLPTLTWEQFSMEPLNRYGSDGITSPYERMAAVKQTGTVDAYIDDFVARAA
ncbi:hypothetical protein P3X46_025833 [Hevea brasiliensis]|uniref:Retrotransposon gag domain-containing protein n=1 Tax=Hevea brasiliensis TaxID=3981 RepID=A0ABQ9L6Z8_HEVBR|nr:hypothetical protein P3X46_025833 [Hevea brasiliensis]